MPLYSSFSFLPLSFSVIGFTALGGMLYAEYTEVFKEAVQAAGFVEFKKVRGLAFISGHVGTTFSLTITLILVVYSLYTLVERYDMWAAISNWFKDGPSSPKRPERPSYSNTNTHELYSEIFDFEVKPERIGWDSFDPRIHGPPSKNVRWQLNQEATNC